MFSRALTRVELAVMGLRFEIEAGLLRFLINSIILPQKWILFGPSRIYCLK
jgi:hypothetical protein